MMNVKKIKRKCMVNGCKNLVSFSITRRHQFGNSIHICPECLNEAAKKINETECKPPSANEKETKTECICPVCNKAYKSEASLKQHMKTHAKEG